MTRVRMFVLLALIAPQGALYAQVAPAQDSVRREERPAPPDPARREQRTLPLRVPSISVFGSVEAREQMAAARLEVELPFGKVARPWIAAGVFDLIGWYCPVPDITSCGVKGTTVEGGEDFMLVTVPADVQPFVGVGAGYHQLKYTDMLVPVLRAGADLQLWRRVCARAQTEWTRYPVQGSVFLWTVGLRVDLAATQ